MLRCYARTVNLAFMLSFCLLLLGLGSVRSVYAQMGGGGMGGGGMSGGSNVSGGMENGMAGLMLVSGGTPYHSNGMPVQMDDAISIASRFLNTQGAAGLALDEVEEWDYNFYVVVKEASPSQYKAYQLIIDKWTGTVMPEPGPNMMWNLKYGKMMNGMSGHPKRSGNFNMTVTADQAVAAGNQFLQQRFGPSHSYTVDGQPDTYYGYYTCDIKDALTGLKVGMLSVNGITGQVWYHTWHGAFVQVREVN